MEVNPREEGPEQVLLEEIATGATKPTRSKQLPKGALMNALAESSPTEPMFPGVTSERTTSVSLAVLISVFTGFTRYLYSSSGKGTQAGRQESR